MDIGYQGNAVHACVHAAAVWPLPASSCIASLSHAAVPCRLPSLLPCLATPLPRPPACSYGFPDSEEDEEEESIPAARRQGPGRGGKRKRRSGSDDSDEDYELDKESAGMALDK